MSLVYLAVYRRAITSGYTPLWTTGAPARVVGRADADTIKEVLGRHARSAADGTVRGRDGHGDAPRFAVDSVWMRPHTLAFRDSSNVYVALTTDGYGAESVRELLVLVAKAHDAGQRDEFDRLFSLYTRPDGRQLTQIQNDLVDTRATVQRALADVMVRGDKLEGVQRRSDALMRDSERFRASTHQLNRGCCCVPCARCGVM